MNVCHGFCLFLVFSSNVGFLVILKSFPRVSCPFPPLVITFGSLTSPASLSLCCEPSSSFFWGFLVSFRFVACSRTDVLISACPQHPVSLVLARKGLKTKCRHCAERCHVYQCKRHTMLMWRWVGTRNGSEKATKSKCARAKQRLTGNMQEQKGKTSSKPLEAHVSAWRHHNIRCVFVWLIHT